MDFALPACTLSNTLDAIHFASPQWILLATVQDGGVLREDALTAVHHRRSGTNY